MFDNYPDLLNIDEACEIMHHHQDPQLHVDRC